VAINLSASDFHSARLIEHINEKIQRYAVKAEQIKIEVTERGFIDVAKTTPVIQAFRDAGYEIAIDDFGTGYSNLHNLHALNVDVLKIDKSFVDMLTSNTTSHLIAEHIIQMANSLHLKIVAEGVETAEQVAWLQNAACSTARGGTLRKRCRRRSSCCGWRMTASASALISRLSGRNLMAIGGRRSVKFAAEHPREGLLRHVAEIHRDIKNRALGGS
jgi:EAL domain-containing protein (putative c-di-GMP-specific phosphodiesterase class I)